ncbi:hypothetical protein [Anaeromicrobium sediminis]|uniref:hypothetical protein n=1 Tax=Anaeromicrobium sediminis TaxID=1478221 RepID=UPI00114044AF|nr:hypothetical protein [Anaeromicrobium sediminis]
MNNGKAIVSELGSELHIEIPSVKNWFLTIFYMVWLGGWAFGEITVLKMLFSGGESVGTFLLVWLTGWTMGGFFAIFVVLWSIFGKEEIYLDRSYISIKRGIFGIGSMKEYDKNSIENLRVSVIYDGNLFSGRKKSIKAITGIGNGSICFDYGMKTIRVGASIEEPEAKYLVNKLMEYEVGKKETI